jgi:hypothetical protein
MDCEEEIDGRYRDIALGDAARFCFCSSDVKTYTKNIIVIFKDFFISLSE